jgi:hypothetical protein
MMNIANIDTILFFIGIIYLFDILLDSTHYLQCVHSSSNLIHYVMTHCNTKFFNLWTYNAYITFSFVMLIINYLCVYFSRYVISMIKSHIFYSMNENTNMLVYVKLIIQILCACCNIIIILSCLIFYFFKGNLCSGLIENEQIAHIIIYPCGWNFIAFILMIRNCVFSIVIALSCNTLLQILIMKDDTVYEAV